MGLCILFLWYLVLREKNEMILKLSQNKLITPPQNWGLEPGSQELKTFSIEYPQQTEPNIKLLN